MKNPKYHYHLEIHPLHWNSFFYQKIGVAGYRVAFLCFTLDKSFNLP